MPVTRSTSGTIHFRGSTGHDANIRSHMPPPAPVVRARLDRALAGGDLAAVRAAVRDGPSVVTLADAVRVLMLMVEADDPAFERAAVRWLARFTGECGGGTVRRAAGGPGGPPNAPAAGPRAP